MWIPLIHSHDEEMDGYSSESNEEVYSSEKTRELEKREVI